MKIGPLFLTCLVTFFVGSVCGQHSVKKRQTITRPRCTEMCYYPYECDPLADKCRDPDDPADNCKEEECPKMATCDEEKKNCKCINPPYSFGTCGPPCKEDEFCNKCLECEKKPITTTMTTTTTTQNSSDPDCQNPDMYDHEQKVNPLLRCYDPDPSAPCIYKCPNGSYCDWPIDNLYTNNTCICRTTQTKMPHCDSDQCDPGYRCNACRVCERDNAVPTTSTSTTTSTTTTNQPPINNSTNSSTPTPTITQNCSIVSVEPSGVSNSTNTLLTTTQNGSTTEPSSGPTTTTSTPTTTQNVSTVSIKPSGAPTSATSSSKPKFEQRNADNIKPTEDMPSGVPILTVNLVMVALSVSVWFKINI